MTGVSQRRGAPFVCSALALLCVACVALELLALQTEYGDEERSVLLRKVVKLCHGAFHKQLASCYPVTLYLPGSRQNTAPPRPLNPHSSLNFQVQEVESPAFLKLM